jgi:hypothetical protein
MTDYLIPGLGDLVFGKAPSGTWVAEITGFDPKFKYARKFLRYKKEYSRSNSAGSRGVYAEFTLESGKMYEIKHRVSWNKSERYFAKVTDDGDIVEIDEAEVIAWLKAKSQSASMS